MPRNKYRNRPLKSQFRRPVFLHKGYQNTTLQDIIDATKLSKGAVPSLAPKEEIAQRVGDRLGDQMWSRCAISGTTRLDRAAEAAGGVCSILCRAAAAADRADFAAPVRNPQFLAMELTNIEAHLAPECIAPTDPARHGGRLHPQLPMRWPTLFVLADIWLSPRRTPPRRLSSGRGMSFSKMTHAGLTFDGCRGRWQLCTPVKD